MEEEMEGLGQHLTHLAPAPGDSMTQTPPQPERPASPPSHRPYDYLVRVKALAEAIRPGLYEDLFKDSVTSRVSRAMIIEESRAMIIDETVPATLSTILEIMALPNREEGKPHILIIEDINEELIQAIGPFWNIPPSCFKLYLNPDPWSGEALDDGLRRLDAAFKDASKDGQGPHNNTNDQQELYEASFPRQLNLTFLFRRTVYHQQFKEILKWANHRYGRLSQEKLQSSPTIGLPVTCYEVALGQWIIFTDSSPFSSVQKGVEPFFPKSWLGCGYPPNIPLCLREMTILPHSLWIRLGDLLSTSNLRMSSHETSGGDNVARVLFVSRSTSSWESWSEAIQQSLPALLTVSIWHRNITYLEGRLDSLRHIAVADPSRTTFARLMLLRKNISDLQHAILRTRDSIGDHQRSSLRYLQAPIAQQLGTFEEMYATLTQRARNLALSLDHEVPLIVASVNIERPGLRRHETAGTTSNSLDVTGRHLSSIDTGDGNLRDEHPRDFRPKYRSSRSSLLDDFFFLGYLLWGYVHEKMRAASREQDNKAYKIA